MLLIKCIELFADCRFDLVAFSDRLFHLTNSRPVG
jgi:hypothetical protein